MRFLAIHHNNWRRAEDHWELAVARTLNSSAVHRNASRRRAMRKAVEAASAHLSVLLLHARCPFCTKAEDR